MFDHSEISTVSTSLEVAYQLGKQGNRIWPVEQKSDDWPILPVRATDSLGFHLDEFVNATKDVAKIAHLFTTDDILPAVVSGTLDHQIWRIWDVLEQKLVFLREVKVENPVTPERSQEYVPKNNLDLGPTCSHMKTISDRIKGLELSRSKIEDRVAKLQKEIEAHERLTDRRDALIAKVRASKTDALVTGSPLSIETHAQEIEELRDLIKKSAPEAEAARGAIRIMMSDMSKLSTALVGLREDLDRAETAWLRAQRNVLFEAFREQMHGLNSTMARILAVESSPNFKGVETGWEFVEELNLLFQPKFEGLKPDWVNTARPTRFPGFSNAKAWLEGQKAAGISGPSDRSDANG